MTARSGEVVHTVRATGSVVARDASALRADLDGLRIVTVEVEAGDLVQAGDVLARLDDTMLRAEERELAARLTRSGAVIQQSRNQVEDAEIALSQASADMQRSGSLQRQGIVSSQTAETRDTTLKRAAMARSMAYQALQVAMMDRRVIEAEAEHLTARLEKAVVRSPVAGRVLDRAATVGMLASVADKILFLVAEGAIVEVEAELPEQDFVLVRVGQSVQLRLVGHPDPVRGEVRLVLPHLQSGTRLGRVRIALPSGTDLPTGAFVRGEIEVSQYEGVVLPASAVSTGESENAAWIERDGVVKRVTVVPGLRTKNVVQVVSGIEEGASVVLKAGSLLNDGERIIPVEVDYELPSSPSSALLSLRAAR